MSEAIIAALLFIVTFCAPARLTRYWGQPRLLASLLALSWLVGLAVIGWLVAAYWRQPLSRSERE
jgi:hypothetical protein